MKTKVRMFIYLLISITIISSGCYVYTNPYDPLAEPSLINIDSVTVQCEDVENESWEHSLIFNFADVAVEVDEYVEYYVVASPTHDGFIYHDKYWVSNQGESKVETGGSEKDWFIWSDIFFRVGYRIDKLDNWSSRIIWSEIFHYPMDPYNPMDGGITLSTGPRLDWTDDDFATGYEIDYAKTLSGLDGLADTSTNTSDSAVWSGISLAVDDTVYWRYRVSGRNDDETVHHLWGHTATFTVKADPVVGDKYAGGYVFYLDGGGNGMIVTDQLVAEEVRWGAVGNDIAGDDNLIAPELTGIGDGQANTSAIDSALGADAVASRTCTDLIYRGFSDWYLPSLDELEEVESITSFIGYFRHSSSTGEGIWTSSEYDADNAYVGHDDGNFARYKQGLHNVLAVRDFTY